MSDTATAPEVQEEVTETIPGTESTSAPVEENSQTPAEENVPVSVEEGAKENIFSDIADLDGDTELEELVEEEPADSEKQIPEEAAPAEKEIAKPEETPAQTKVEEPLQQPAPAQQQEPQPEAEVSPTPTDLNATYKQVFDSGVEALEKVYALDEKTADALDEEPSKFLPKFAAQVHMQAMLGAMTQMANMFPQLMQMNSENLQVEQEAENSFFDQYPGLKDHKPVVTQVARAYRQMNPKATKEQAIQEIAAMSMVAAKVPIPGTQPEQPAVTTPPVTPTSAQGGPGAIAPAQKTTIWEEIIKEEE